MNALSNNKRIAKNTLLLYVRMLLMVTIGLYTSRVVLHTLGVQDFGINNVVGGIVAMLGFLQASLSAASSRYITFDLGKGNMQIMKRTFGNINTIHIIFAAIIFILGETVGLWFVMEKLVIPHNRMTAALWVYQFSILTSMVSVISVPYNATIIAHEKMSAFAYISIYEAIAKLVVVFLLTIIPFDKLILYAMFLFFIQCSSRLIYNIYCFRHFEETRAKLSFDKALFKEIFAFAGWTMNGNLAIIGFTQGLNILLNLFFGPAINAARGIAVQVQSIVRQFCTNFQMALNPQITKSYAQNNLDYMHKLIITSSKFSFFILFFITLPLALEAHQILNWWLGIIPEHTINFLRLILCTAMIFTLSNPIVTAVHATGNIRKFQIIEGTMLLSIVPIAYILLKIFNFPPESVFLVHIGVELCTQWVRLYLVLPMINMSLKIYYKEVILRIVSMVILVPILPLWVQSQLKESITSFFLVCMTSVLCLIAGILGIGCNKEEKNLFCQKLFSFINKNIFRKITLKK